MGDAPPYPGTPRWVKAAGFICGVLVLLFVVIKFTGVGGRHDSGRHIPSGDAGGQTPPSSTGGHDGHAPSEDGHR